jgi:hypothetical protein
MIDPSGVTVRAVGRLSDAMACEIGASSASVASRLERLAGFRGSFAWPAGPEYVS